MTEFLKGYAAGANDMEAGRLVRVGPLLVAAAPTLTAEEAKTLLAGLGEIEDHWNDPPANLEALVAKLSLVANGENG